VGFDDRKIVGIDVGDTEGNIDGVDGVAVGFCDGAVGKAVGTLEGFVVGFVDNTSISLNST